MMRAALVAILLLTVPSLASAESLGAGNAQIEALYAKRKAGEQFTADDWALYNRYTADAAEYQRLGEPLEYNNTPALRAEREAKRVALKKKWSAE